MESGTLERSELEGKVLPELQRIADGLGVTGHQRLRKGDLIDAILSKANGGDGAAGDSNGDGRPARAAVAEKAAPATEAAEAPAANGEATATADTLAEAPSVTPAEDRSAERQGRPPHQGGREGGPGGGQPGRPARGRARAVTAARRARSAGGCARSAACARWSSARRRSPPPRCGPACWTCSPRATGSFGPPAICPARRTCTSR